jgi:predicted Zn-dependent protease with MMP-like domain
MKLNESEFTKVVEEALKEIPESLRHYMADVVIDVEPRPSRSDLDEVGIDDPTELLGMYHGTPMTEWSSDMSPRLPDRITIYHKNLEAICETREELIEQIRTTVFHEVGHYFGLDEDDLEALGYE